MKKNILQIITLLLLINCYSIIKAQDGNTIYFMQNIPQSGYSNPALFPNCKFYLGIPGMSSLFLNINNGSFSYNDIFTRRADDSLIIDKDKLLNALSDNNKLSYEISQQLFAMGFRIKKNYISFGVNYKMTTNFNYTKDFMTFLLKGNEPFIGKTANLGDSKFGLNSYSELSFGYSREFGKKLSFGARFKYLIGIANVYTEKSVIQLYTDPNTYEITATSDFLVHTSTPFDSLKNFDNQAKKIKWEDLSKNNGFAVDFGAEYRLNKRWHFGISLIDLGSINWKMNTKDYISKNPNAQFTFSGFDINEVFKNGELKDSIFEKMLDSIKETMGITDVEGKSYKSPLKTKLYLSASYNLTPRDRFGFLLLHEFVNNDVNRMFSISYNRNIGRFFAITLSNTMVSGQLFNPGGGISFALGPFQTYIIGDHFSSVYLADMKNFGIHFGMNLIFGKTKQGYRYEKIKTTNIKEDDYSKSKRKITYTPEVPDSMLVPASDTSIVPDDIKPTFTDTTQQNINLPDSNNSEIKDTAIIENIKNEIQPIINDTVQSAEKPVETGSEIKEQESPKIDTPTNTEQQKIAEPPKPKATIKPKVPKKIPAAKVPAKK